MGSEITNILSALGVGGALGSVVTHHLARRFRSEERRIETDKATAEGRRARLIHARLGTLISSSRYRQEDREALLQFVQDLSKKRSDGGTAVVFLTSKVQERWAILEAKTIEYAKRHLEAGHLTASEIADHGRAWDAWYATTLRELGPLRESDPPMLRPIAGDLDPQHGEGYSQARDAPSLLDSARGGVHPLQLETSLEPSQKSGDTADADAVEVAVQLLEEKGYWVLGPPELQTVEPGATPRGGQATT